MARIKLKCENCQHMGLATVGQHFQPVDQTYRLVWFRSFYCQYCSNAFEEDGDEYPPDIIRQNLLMQEGYWELTCGTVGKAEKVLMLSVIHEALSLSMDQVKTLSRSIPGSFHCGTRIENEWLRAIITDRFSAKGLSVQLTVHPLFELPTKNPDASLE